MPSQKNVSLITDSFTRQIINRLVEDGVVVVDGLGRFQVERVECHRKRIVVLTAGRFKKGVRGGTREVELTSYIRVHFSKSKKLKKKLSRYEEDLMEKYGVDESINQEQLEKKAAKGCPECGRPLTKHGSVLICPEHGSEPFEDEHREK